MASGYNSWVSLLNESTYGTDPGGARAGYARIVSDGAQVNDNPYQAKGMGTRSVRGLYKGRREIDVPLEIETGYEGVVFLQLMRHALGGYGFAGSTPVAGTNTHTLTAADTLPLGFSMEISKGDIPANDVFLYTGCKVNTMELRMDQDSLMTANFGIIARNEAPDTARIGAPSYPTLRPIKSIHYASLSVAGSAVAVISNLRIFVDNKLDRFYNLGRFTSEPLPSVPQELIIECEARFDDLTHYNKFLAGTEGSASIVISSATNETPPVYITGTTPYSFTVTATTSHLIGDTPKVTGPGVLTVPIRAQFIGANPTASFIIINNQATL